LGLAASAVRGAVVLLDAESDQDMKVWSRLDRVTADLVPYLPMRGEGSARLAVTTLQSATGGRSGEVSGVPAAEGGIASMVSQMPEQSLSVARLGLPERHPVAMMLGYK